MLVQSDKLPVYHTAPRRVDLFSEISKEMDHILNEAFGGKFFAGRKGRGYPLMDAIRGEGTLTLQYTVPGVKIEELDVELGRDEHGRIVTVSGRLSEEYMHSDEKYHIRELSSKEFRRVVGLPDDVTEDEPQAILKDGLLRLVFSTAKVENGTPQSKKLRIKSE